MKKMVLLGMSVPPRIRSDLFSSCPAESAYATRNDPVCEAAHTSLPLSAGNQRSEEWIQIVTAPEPEAEPLQGKGAPGSRARPIRASPPPPFIPPVVILQAKSDSSKLNRASDRPF